ISRCVSIASFMRPLVVLNAVVTRHPIREDVVDAGALDSGCTLPDELERASLPQKVGARPFYNRYRCAGSVFCTTSRIFTAQVGGQVAPRSEKPLTQYFSRFVVASFDGSIERAIDHVEESVLMIVSMPPQDIVGIAVEFAKRAALQANQVEEIN